ncbi:MAG: hypothetical protein KBD25_00890 [Rickettsiaceae bacterium]|nr:hypothetical protein [Rickettsiaceae bacterium]
MFSIAKTPENIKIFNTILNISEAHGKIVNNIKLSQDKISFTIKDEDPFVICEFLNSDQIWGFMGIIKRED